MSRSKFVLLPLVLLLVAMTLSGVSAETPEASVAAPGSPDSPSFSLESLLRVDVNLGSQPPTLDPSLATDSTANDTVGNLFAGLTRLDEAGNVLPYLATSWSVSPDGRTYTFLMRDDAHWVRYEEVSGLTELGPVTASDVVYAVRRACDPRTGSRYASVDYIIVGCQDLRNADVGALTPEELQALIDAVGVEAMDAYTVRFELNNPAPYFPAIASMAVSLPLPQSAIEQHGEDWTEPGVIVTSGPYLLHDWMEGEYATLKKNLLHFDAAQVEASQLRLWFIADMQTALDLYRDGELDTMGSPFPEALRDAELYKQLHVASAACTYYYGFTTTKPPLNDVRVRRALSAAIDRQDLINQVTRGSQLPANAFAPPGIFGNAAHDPYIAPWALPEDLGGTGYDAALSQARQWLAAAGYPNGQGFPTIRLMHNTSEGHARIAEAVAAYWEQGLGIRTAVEHQEWRNYLETISNRTPLEEIPHVWRLGWCADYADQNNWVHEVFNTNSGINRPRWESVANAPLAPNGMSFNQLTAAAQAATDPGQRQAYYREAEKILNEVGVAYTPVYYYSTLNLKKPWVERTYQSLGAERYDQWSPTYETGELGQAGGSLVAAGGAATITLPMGVFPPGMPYNTVTLAYVPQTALEPDTVGLATTSYAFELVAFDENGVAVQPASGKAYSIALDYDEEMLGAVVDEATLALYYWHQSGWQREPTSEVDVNANRITATPTRFARWGVFGETDSIFLPLAVR